MRVSKISRAITLIAAIALLAFVVAGCGDDNDGSETGAGAPAGATGSEAGGAAVEAGKQRDPKAVEQERKEFSQEPPPVQLQTGDRSGYSVKKPTVVIAQSNKELNSLTKKIYSDGVDKQDVPPVDFRTRQAVLVQMQDLPRGSLMQIQDVHTENGTMVVRVAQLKPGKGCKRPNYKPNPFNLVETRKMEGAAKVEVEKIQNSPC